MLGEGVKGCQFSFFQMILIQVIKTKLFFGGGHKKEYLYVFQNVDNYGRPLIVGCLVKKMLIFYSWLESFNNRQTVLALWFVISF